MDKTVNIFAPLSGIYVKDFLWKSSRCERAWQNALPKGNDYQRKREVQLCVEKKQSPIAGIPPGVEPGDSFTLRTRASIQYSKNKCEYLSG